MWFLSQHVHLKSGACVVIIGHINIIVMSSTRREFNTRSIYNRSLWNTSLSMQSVALVLETKLSTNQTKWTKTQKAIMKTKQNCP